MKKILISYIALFLSSTVIAQTTENYLMKADSLFERKEYKDAIINYDKAILIDSLNADTYFKRGNTKYEAKDKGDAIADYTMAIKLDPNFIEAYKNRGIVRKKLGNTDGGNADLRKADELTNSLAISTLKGKGVKFNDSSLETEIIVEIPNTTKEELYIRANKWIAKNYRSAKDVIQLNDKESGTILAKGIYSNGSYVDVLHTLEIKIKDNRVKININSLICKYTATTEYTMEKMLNSANWVTSKRQKAELKKMTTARIYSTISELSKALASKEDTDW